MFLDCLLQQEKEANECQAKMSTMVYKGAMRAHSRYRDEEMEDRQWLERELDGLSSDQSTPNLALGFTKEEYDMDLPEEKLS